MDKANAGTVSDSVLRRFFGARGCNELRFRLVLIKNCYSSKHVFDAPVSPKESFPLSESLESLHLVAVRRE
jgi:hypothetical protein